MNERLQRELDPLVCVFVAQQRRERARLDVLRARPEQLVDALYDWLVAAGEVVEAQVCAADRMGVSSFPVDGIPVLVFARDPVRPLRRAS